MAGLTNITGGQLISNRPGGRVYWVGQTEGTAWTGVKGVTPSDGNDGLTPQKPFATIQKGLDACVANRGDTVSLLPGYWTITAALTMTNADVTLRSAFLPATAQRGNARIVCTTDVSMLEIDADDVLVEGVYFDDDVATATANSQTVDIADAATCRRVAIRNCYWNMGGADSDRNCLRLGDGTLFTRHSVIEDCTFLDVDQDAIVISAASDENTIRNCYITDRTSDNIAQYGINCSGDGCIIEGNMIDIGGTANVYVGASATYNRIIGNKLSNDSANGICILHAGTGVKWNKSMGNFLLATSAGNLVDFTTTCLSGNMAANIACTWSSNPVLAAFDTPTVAGS